jgi:hypothetical protein
MDGHQNQQTVQLLQRNTRTGGINVAQIRISNDAAQRLAKSDLKSCRAAFFWNDLSGFERARASNAGPKQTLHGMIWAKRCAA